jgi:hypothetical protein
MSIVRTARAYICNKMDLIGGFSIYGKAEAFLFSRSCNDADAPWFIRAWIIQEALASPKNLFMKHATK